jgi:hypothetical protein
MKTYLKSKAPLLVQFKQYLDALKYQGQVFWHEMNNTSAAPVFNEKFLNNSWAGQESVSGHGSDFIPTQTLREELPRLFKELTIRSLLDAPCGDFYWMSLVNLELEKYIGVDIVSDLIQLNQQKYGGRSREFLKADIIQDNLPRADVILCRDCLVHLSFRDIKRAIQQFKQSNSSYLLTTTYPGLLNENQNIVTGDWRPIDLEKPPFNFPAPIRLIHEESAIVSDLKEKSLGLWRLEDLQVEK